MNWETIGAIGEVVGAIGVAVTLVYLAYQIRQNTDQLEQSTLAAKAAAQNASNEALRENRKALPGGEWFWANYGDNHPAGFQSEVERILQHD